MPNIKMRAQDFFDLWWQVLDANEDFFNTNDTDATERLEAILGKTPYSYVYRQWTSTVTPDIPITLDDAIINTLKLLTGEHHTTLLKALEARSTKRTETENALQDK